ncbi:MAG TPA: FAD:protein FMN transferase [Phycisphaerae bacterium]|nr:FAD:protein FMN transferase [Phycisphaerae bacterium]
MNARRVVAAIAGLALLLLIGLAIHNAAHPDTAGLAARSTQPLAVMGTECELTAVASGPGRDRRMTRALEAAESALRQVEARMSVYIRLSELSRLNAARAGEVVNLSPMTMEVLKLSRDLHRQTDGAFDATCLPLFALWGQAGKAARLPTDAEFAAAKADSGWDKFELLADGVRKKLDGAGIGLGGVAKGFAIDRALEAMRKAGCSGGLVNAGGDVRCFGPSPRGGTWRVAIRDPFDSDGGRFLGVLELTDLAVCTSGNYERFTVIEGKRYSHIVDPRTGRPVDFAPSVTVVAPTAAVADGWATALSVLGEGGLKQIDPNSHVEALIVIGGPEDFRIARTPGLAGLLAGPLDAPATMPAPEAHGG